MFENPVNLVAESPAIERLAPAFEAVADSFGAPVRQVTSADDTGLPHSLAPLMRFRRFAVSDDLARQDLIEERAAEIAHVVRELQPFLGEIRRAAVLKARVVHPSSADSR